jgi:hypothetical protein
LDKYPKRDFIKVSAIEVQLSSGAIAITSFHFSRAWGVLGKSKAPRYCGSEIGLSQSEWILGRFSEPRRKATPECGLWVVAGVSLPVGNNLLEVFRFSAIGLVVDRNGQSIEFVGGQCKGYEIA